MAPIRLMIHKSSYLDSTLLVNPSLRQPMGCVIQVVGRPRRLGKNVFKPKFSTVMPSHSTLGRTEMADIRRRRVRDPPSEALRSVCHGELVELGAERGLLAEQNISVHSQAHQN